MKRGLTPGGPVQSDVIDHRAAGKFRIPDATAIQLQCTDGRLPDFDILDLRTVPVALGDGGLKRLEIGTGGSVEDHLVNARVMELDLR